MTDGQSLLLLFVALYFIESLRWLAPRSYQLIGSGKHWHCQRPFQPIEVAGGCPGLLSVWPPLQTQILTLPWQFIPAEEGLELHVHDRRPVLLPWTEVHLRVEGRHLHLTHGHRVRCLSERHACETQQQVQQWLPMSAAEREADFMHHARQTLLAEPVLTLATKLSDQTRVLRQLGSLIFLWAFVLIVALYRWLGDEAEVLWAAGGLILLQLTQAFLFHRRAKQVPYRFWKTISIALLPQHAMRAADLLSDLHLVSPSHPLAARVLLGDESWRKLVLSFWKRARFQPSQTADLQSRILETFLAEQGMNVAELDIAPKQEPGSALYCPNCQAQFQSSATVCQDCGGVALRAFES